MDIPPPPYQELPERTNNSEPHPSSLGSTRVNLGTPSDLSQIERPLSLIESPRNDRKVWLCPHVGLNFDQAKELFSNLPLSKSLCPVGSINPCNRKVCNANLTQHVRKSHNKHGNLSHHLISTVTLFWAPSSPSPHTSYRDIFSLNRIATALHGLDFPICAHLRLNQTFILSKFNPGCIYTKSHGVDSPCTCYESQLAGSSVRKRRISLPRICKTVGRCPTCHDQGDLTSFIVRVDESTCENGREEVSLSICFARDLGRLETPNNSAWLTSTVKPRELRYMASMWRDWEEHIWKLRDEWFEPLSPSSDPYSSTTGPPINRVVPSPETSDEPISAPNTKASDLKKDIRRTAARCLQRLTGAASLIPLTKNQIQ